MFYPRDLGGVWIRMICVLRLRFQLFFFFFSCEYWLSAWTVYPYTVHGTHKHHFLTTFLLKMDLTVLFIYLKIILLQYFEFSTVSKWTLVPAYGTHKVRSFCLILYNTFSFFFVHFSLEPNYLKASENGPWFMGIGKFRPQLILIS